MLCGKKEKKRKTFKKKSIKCYEQQQYHDLKQIFRIFDINNDGTLSPDEMDKLVKDLSKMFTKKDNPNTMSHEELAHKAFKEMDADSDGKITQEEFVRACLNHETISKMLALKVIDVFTGSDGT